MRRLQRLRWLRRQKVQRWLRRLRRLQLQRRRRRRWQCCEAALRGTQTKATRLTLGGIALAFGGLVALARGIQDKCCSTLKPD